MQAVKDELWKVWLLFDPRRALIAVFAFLIVLALLIHMLLLSVPKYNWLEQDKLAPPAQGQTR